MKKPILRLGAWLWLVWATASVAGAASVRLEYDTVYAQESATNVVLKLVLSNEMDHEVSLAFTAIDGSAVSGEDYEAVSGTVTFAPGETVHTLYVPILPDAQPEGQEWFEVRLEGDAGVIGVPGTATVYILDDDPGVRFASSHIWISEQVSSVRLEVVCGGNVGIRSVPFTTADGSALAGKDYTAIGGTLQFDTNHTTLFIEVPFLNDGLVEGEEQFQVRLPDLADPQTLTVHIRDNDYGVRVAQEELSVYETSGSIQVEVLFRGDAGEYTVDFATEDGSAVAGLDYTAISGSLTFDEKHKSRWIEVPIVNDVIREGDETFQIRLQGPGDIVLPPTVATVTIQRTDQGARFTAANWYAGETSGSVRLTVRYDGDFETNTVQYSTVDGTAMAGSDYTAVSGSLTLEGDSIQFIEVPILNDNLREGKETFQVHLEGEAGVLGQTSIATVRIADDDDAGQLGVRFAVPEMLANEQTSLVRLEVHSDLITGTNTVQYTTIVGGSATAGVDFEAVSGSLTFDGTHQVQYIDVPILNDGLVEGAESFQVQLAGAAVGQPSVVTVYIQDNDLGVRFTAWGTSVTENTASVRLEVRQEGEIGTNTVQFSTVAGGSATAGTDFEAVSGSLTFDGTNQVQYIDVPILNDGLVEELEWFEVQLAGAAVGQPSVVTVYIQDNDLGVRFTAWATSVTENTASVRLEVRQEGEIGTNTVQFSTVAGGSATAGTDFEAVSGSLTFDGTNQVQYIDVPLLNDGLVEGDEWFQVQLAGAAVGQPSVVMVYIQDNDLGVRFTAWHAWVPENAGSVRLEVRQDGDMRDNTVQFSTVAEGSATAGIDYEAVSGSLTFDGTNQVQYIDVPILNDGLVEGEEWFEVQLIGEAVGQPNPVTVSIQDNDLGVRFTAWATSVPENAGSVRLEVRQDGDMRDNTVQFTTVDVSATAGMDFESVSGSITFDGTNQVQYIEVPVLNDGLVEGDEWFEVQLAGAAVGQPNTVTVRIQDNDQSAPWFENPVLVEADVFTHLVLHRGNDGSQPQTFRIEVVGGTATEGVDYLLGTREVAFGAGVSTQAVTIATADDWQAEGPETIVLRLTSSTEGEIGDFTLTLVDDEEPVSGLDGSFESPLDSNTELLAFALQPDGKMLVSFRDPTAASARFWRLEPDGSQDASFVPDMGNGQVSLIAVQPDGRILCNRGVLGETDLVRLLPDGRVDAEFQLDPAFAGSPMNWLQTLALQPDGRVLVVFGHNTNERWVQRLARLQTNGALDAGFGIRELGGDNCWIRALLPLPDGRILVGGRFNQLGTANVQNIARLYADGGHDATFSSDWGTVNGGGVLGLFILPDQRVLASGNFEWCQGVRRPSLVRLEPNGALDLTFDSGFQDPGYVLGVQPQPDGRLLVHGEWLPIRNNGRQGLARLEADGAFNPSLTWTVDGGVRHLAQLGDGTAYIAGGFNSVGGLSSPRLARVILDTAGRVSCRFGQSDYSVVEGAGPISLTLRRQGDLGSDLSVAWFTEDATAQAGVDYTAQSGTLVFGPDERAKTVTVPVLDNGTVDADRMFRVRVTSDAAGFVTPLAARISLVDNETPVSVDLGFAEGTGGWVQTLLVQPDGRILLAGSLRFEGEAEFMQVARVLADGRRDPSFQPVRFDGTPRDLALDSQGRILACGWFGVVGDQSVPGVARLLPNGAVDPSFKPGGDVASGGWQIAATTDGRILVLQDCGGLQRLEADGRVDALYQPDLGPVGCAHGFAALPDGSVWVVGDAGLIRLNLEGTADPGFTPPVFEDTSGYGTTVQRVRLLPDGRLLVVGRFTEVGGHPTRDIARLHSDGSVDTSFAQTGEPITFSPWGGWYPSLVRDAAIEADGHVVIVGDFSRIGEEPRNCIARLGPDGQLAEGPDRFQITGGGWRWGLPFFTEVEVLHEGGYLAAGSFWTVNGERPPGVVRFHPPGLGSLVEFAIATVDAVENQGTAQVRIRRIGDVSAGASVQVRAGTGTATLGADVLFTTVTVQFAPMQTERTVPVTLLNDALLEGDEWLGLKLSAASGAALGRAATELVVLDDELQGTPDKAFTSPFTLGWDYWSSYVENLFAQPDGAAVVTGSLPFGFDPGGNQVFRMAVRLRPDGSLDNTFELATGVSWVLASQPDGRLLARSNAVDGGGKYGLVRLLPDGSPDASFVSGIRWAEIAAACVTEDGRVFMAGRETLTDQNPSTPLLVRLNADGSLDTSFQATFQGPAYAQIWGLVPGPQGSVLVCGNFDTVNGVACSRLTWLDARGDRMPGFELRDPFSEGSEPRNAIYSVLSLDDGGVLIAGSFNVAMGDRQVAGLVRLNPDGSVDPAFSHGAGARDVDGNANPVPGMLQTASGKILVRGPFTHYDGHYSPRIARLHADGSLDTSFRTPGMPIFRRLDGDAEQGQVNAVSVLATGDILVGGWFTSWGSVDACLLLRVSGEPLTWFTGQGVVEEGVFRFGLHVKPGHTYVLECSEDLRTWTPVSTNTAAASELWFDDLDAPVNTRRFFRTVEQ